MQEVRGITNDPLLESYRKFVSVAIKLYNSSPCCWEESLATFELWLLFKI